LHGSLAGALRFRGHGGLYCLERGTRSASLRVGRSPAAYRRASRAW